MKLLLGSIAVVLALGLGAYPATAQQIQYACDENGDGSIDATEARLCTEREFDEVAADEEVLREDQLGAMGKDREGTPPAFAEVDENGDGEIIREEWIAFSERRFAGATEASGGQMSAEDYERWRQEGMRR